MRKKTTIQGKHESGGTAKKTAPKKQKVREPPKKKEPKPRRQPFLKRLIFGEEKADLAELEIGATTILDILSPTSADTRGRDYIVVDGIFHCKKAERKRQPSRRSCFFAGVFHR